MVAGYNDTQSSHDYFPHIFRVSQYKICHKSLHGSYLHVSVDVEAVVLGGEHHGAVVHQRDVETLGVLHLEEMNIKSILYTSIVS